jgi:hypothetical protein
MSLVINKTEETTHLRSKSRFYVAGWVANREGENPQILPESCKGDATVEKWHEEYLNGYGDSVSNSECLNPPVEDQIDINKGISL